MRSIWIRTTALVLGVAVVWSCDTRLPSSPTAIAAGSGKPAAACDPVSDPSCTSAQPKDTVKPSVVVDTPVAGALLNIGDSVLVRMVLHDDKALGRVTLSAVSIKGLEDLGN